MSQAVGNMLTSRSCPGRRLADRAKRADRVQPQDPSQGTLTDQLLQVLDAAAGSARLLQTHRLQGERPASSANKQRLQHMPSVQRWRTRVFGMMCSMKSMSRRTNALFRGKSAPCWAVARGSGACRCRGESGCRTTQGRSPVRKGGTITGSRRNPGPADLGGR